MRKINYADYLEQMIGDALQEKGVFFTHESEVIGQRLDFHLPVSNVYIEVKQFYSEICSDQLMNHENVILLQGKQSVLSFINFILCK